MSHCLNPACSNPHNPDDAQFCQNCGASLRLGGRYRPLKVIGEGGFGKTFLAVDEAAVQQHDGSPAYCVIKQVFPAQRGDAERLARLFRAEVDCLKQLGKHPQIPRLLAHYKTPNGFYLVQEYIDGENLEQRLNRTGTFSEHQIRHLLEELLPILEFIHRHRVIHRDIKPENIIHRRSPLETSSSSHAPTYTLVDFGASKYLPESRPHKTGTVIGSAGYAAPEQVMGKATFASDLYSLGVTCIHLLTGQHPFDLYSVSKDSWVWEQYLPEPISPTLQRVLNKMLQRPLEQRYRSAAAALQDLRFQAVPVLANKIPVEATVSQAEVLALPPVHRPPRWHPQTPSRWTCRGTLMGHAGGITTLAVSPDGRLLASGSSDRSIKLWDLASGELLHTFAGQSLRFLAGHRDRITALCFSPDGQMVISGSEDGSLKFWDLFGYQLLTTLPSQGWGISALSTSTTVPTLASGDIDGRIDLWNLTTGDPIGVLGKHRARVSALLLSPDGKTLISASHDQTIRLWDVVSSQSISTLRGHKAPISALVVTPDWRTLISASLDRELRWWDLQRREKGQTIIAHQDAIYCLAIAPNAGLLATGSEDSRVKLWPLRPNEAGTIVLDQARPQVLMHSWAVNALTFTPDGQTLVSGGEDETIRIWQPGA